MSTQDTNALDRDLRKLLNVKKEIWYIHGANATPNSFNYIRNAIDLDPDFDEYAQIDFKYDCQLPIASIIDTIARVLPENRPVYIVGHSLGGVIASRVAQKVKHFELPGEIKGVFTMSAPFGGSEAADYLKWLYPSYHLFKNISTQNRAVIDLTAAGVASPTLSLVTSSGNNPLMPVANDGVVTVNSQRALPGAKYVEVPYNHFEVLVSDETIEHLKVFLKTTK